MANRRGGDSTADLDALAVRVRAVRDRYGLTQAEFADAVGVSRSFLSEMESGRSRPSTQLVLGIASYFPDVDRDWLLSGRGHIVWWEHDEPNKAPLAGRMRFGSEAKLSDCDIDALVCAVELFQKVDPETKNKLSGTRQTDFVSVLYNFYIGAIQDAFHNDILPQNRRAYAAEVCASWARKLASLVAGNAQPEALPNDDTTAVNL
jgi:transcriptional regulator with XRE-family HTH domain